MKHIFSKKRDEKKENEKESKKLKTKKSKNSLLSKFQKLGRTFMLPIAVMAFCGIFLGIGASLTSEATLTQMPWLKTRGLFDFFVFLKLIGNIGFTFLPFMFAMAIPLGLASDNQGVAALSGFLGYATMLFSINFTINIFPSSWLQEGTFIGRTTKEILGIQTMDIGVLGAIFVGLIIYKLHEKFQYINLPNAISFWGGTRFVPIISILLFSVLALPATFFWPAIAQLLAWVGLVVQKIGVFGPFLYRFTESLVRPTGIHHVINSIIRYTEAGGSWQNPVNNEIVYGALNIFYEQLKYNQPISAEATRFLSQGYMPTVMFGLPMAGLAIYLLAQKEQKPMVKSIIVPGIVASVVGGITEPIEFLFLFVAPMLYLIHCFFIGMAYLFVALLQVKIGNTDGNIIDFIVFGVIQGLNTKWYYILVIGSIWGFLYFNLFYFYIKLRNVQIIGRTELTPEEKESIVQKVDKNKVNDFDKVAEKYLHLLGGKENIESLNNCYTRLRITLKETKQIQQEDVKKLGAIAIKYIDELNIQIIIGPRVEKLKNEIAKLMKSG
ncbi:PTS transporter subunit EIIC [Spiroplasma floricola]|uniref:PTS system, maltose/glucose-specific IIB component n=1 Tax=Spiroplasma floricola 23-6 TaxID=1336749 RepID=A0A2K8SDQ8_9MOLU|nr:PTS transporter subunit EIIC [Spiroplasma floricola]AUB31563.1 PTS system, maltose/glucose-specific IIB component [Spiroplasma floricola 23-6]